MGLPAGQPRGIPISNPPLRAGGCALIQYNFESKVQMIISRLICSSFLYVDNGFSRISPPFASDFSTLVVANYSTFHGEKKTCSRLLTFEAGVVSVGFSLLLHELRNVSLISSQIAASFGCGDM